MPTSAPRSTSTAGTTCEGIRWNPESDGSSHFKIPTSAPSKTNRTGLLSVQTKACGLSCRGHGEALLLMFPEQLRKMDQPNIPSPTNIPIPFKMDQSSKTHSDICFALVQNAAYFMNILKWNHLWRQQISRVSDLPCSLISEAIWNIWNAVVSFSQPAKMTPGCSTITVCVCCVYQRVPLEHIASPNQQIHAEPIAARCSAQALLVVLDIKGKQDYHYDKNI